ncbi:MAG TPA: ABC transporter permease [Thermoflexia bacterium]|nr:ABC transporter permease [Thermoflexia bacterium]
MSWETFAASINRLAAITRKESLQLLRAWPTLLMIISMPVIELFLFAYVGEATLEHLTTVVADLERGSHSRAFIAALETSGFFDMELYVSGEAEVLSALDDGQAQVGVVIPPNFGTRLEEGTAQVLIIIDGSDSYVVQSAYSAAGAIAQQYGMDLLLEQAARRGLHQLDDLPIDTSLRILYNPNIDQVIFLVPGLAAMLLQLISVNVTVMSVVRERELGTLEQLLVTPARPLELIIGKMIPSVLLVTVNLAIIIWLGVYWFKVPFQGSLWLFGWLALLFIVSGLGLGLLLSTVAQNQKQAQQMTSMIMLLTMLLTGLFYSRAPMPRVVQLLGNLIPTTYFIRIARGIMTKGVGLSFLWPDVAALVIYGVIVIVVAAKTFKIRLD